MRTWRRVATLMEVQKAMRPEMRARDAYKLLYQGVFGVGHIMGPGAWDYLQSESAALDIMDHPEDPMLEEAALDGSLVRVNLRPFLREGYSLVKLMEAMRLSDITGSPAAFLEAWDAFAELVWSWELDFEHNEVDALNKALDRVKPQPLHHSQQYRDAYHPAYRVVRRREIFSIIGI